MRTCWRTAINALALCACGPVAGPVVRGSDQLPSSLPPETSASVASEQGPEEAASRVSLRDELPADFAAWATTEPEQAGLSREVLERIVRKAGETETSSLLIDKAGELVVERYFGRPRRPIETMSMTKSVVSLAIGLLIEERKIKSVDEPLSTFYPEFAKGKKARITLRHVLTHSSGLSHGQGAGELNKQKDRLKYARAQEVVSEPGSVFSYSNEATQLLSGVIEQAAGKPVDAYLSEKLFAPLGITQLRWARDDAGNVQTFYGFAVGARDLVKLGRLLVDGGQYEGKQLLAANWIAAMAEPQGPADYHGYLWWLRYRRGTVGMTRQTLSALEKELPAARALGSMIGRTFPATAERAAFWLEAGALLDGPARGRLSQLRSEGLAPYEQKKGERFAFAADGWLGQQLIVIPEARIVVVRQHEIPEGRQPDDADNQRVGYFQLIDDIDAALERPPGH